MDVKAFSKDVTTFLPKDGIAIQPNSGYQPVCEREWNRDFCDKRKYKCVECPNRRFASLSYEHIYNHLAGKDELGRDVIGMYPILKDNTCNFLCVDFDDKSCEHGFQNDVLVFVGVCNEWNVPCYIDAKTYTQIVEAMSQDKARNGFIVEDVKKAIEEGRTPILLTSLTSHVRLLVEMLSPHVSHVITLVGADSTKEKRAAMEQLQKMPVSEPLVIVATGKYIGEGFDYPRLDTLFLALPISWKGNIAQYAGRLHREYKDKHEVRIYDYVDIRVPLCDSMYRKRLKGYASVGYGIPALSGEAEKAKHELIYDGSSFLIPFRQDLLSIKHNIVISCQKVKYKYTPRLVSQLRDMLANGIEVVVHVKEQGYNEDDLIKAGAGELLDVLFASGGNSMKL